MRLLMIGIGFVIGALIAGPIGYMACALLSFNKFNSKDDENNE